MNAIIPVDDCSPIAYENVYELGDRWEKIRGCDDCSREQRIKCCGSCPMILRDTGECRIHDQRGGDKPFYCVIRPFPNICKRTCVLEFKSIAGSRKGQIRRIADPGNVFVEERGDRP